MSLRYRFYNRYPETETNEACLWHRVNHPVPITSFSTGWNTNRYQRPLCLSLASSPRSPHPLLVPLPCSTSGTSDSFETIKHIILN